jgi:DNA repair exonuclease SbcCD nuclease subunit
MSTPDAIITADIHLREDQPICRTDNYWEEQERKLLWLSQLQEAWECPILDAGDIFQHWKPSPYLLQWALRHLPNGIITVPGNHDLPSHSLDLYDKSGLSVLEEAGKVKVLKAGEVLEGEGMIVRGFPWGIEPQDCTDASVALCHYMTYIGRSPFPGCTDPGADKFLKSMSGYDLVITGHNHKTFTVEKDGRMLVNPGSLTRHKADQVDHKPCVFLWYADKNRVEQKFIPITEGVVSREHLDVVEHKDVRIDAFVNKLNSGPGDIGLSFEENIETFLSTNRIRKGTKDMIWSFVK